MCAATRLPPVLVADDDPDAIFLSRHVLVKAGLENPIVTVQDGEEAIVYLRGSCLAAGSPRGRKPVAVFLDVNMPRVDGFKVLRWLQRKKAFGKMKKFMLTTSDNPEHRRRAAELGAHGYLVKHPAPSVMAGVIRGALAPRPLGSGARAAGGAGTR